MISNYITIALASLAVILNEKGLRSNLSILSNVKRGVQASISAIIFQLLVGIVLAAIATYSAFQIGTALQTIFDRYQGGPELVLATFSVAFSLCLIALILIFKPNFKTLFAGKPVIQAQPGDKSVELILYEFADGFIDGFIASDKSPGSNRRRDLDSDF